MMKASNDLNSLQDALGVTFSNLSLLEQSLVHRSFLNENPEFSLPSNERLEFLGDALLGFVVSERLYTQFPHLAEGDLTKLRAALVRKETLARLATSLRLGDYLYLGKGEESSGGRKRMINLACVFEAVVGAIFIDQGFETAAGFILRQLSDEMERALKEGLVDYKSRLQELVQSRGQAAPVYQIIATAGPEHNREFTVEVCVEGTALGRGAGRSKKAAEQEAARVALENLAESW